MVYSFLAFGSDDLAETDEFLVDCYKKEEMVCLKE